MATDPVADLQQQIDELERMKQMSESATKPLEQELTSLQKKISNAQQGIIAAEKQTKELEQNIINREDDLAVQYIIFTHRIAQQYKRSRTFSPLMLFFNSTDASKLTKNLAYSSSVQAQDNHLIHSLTQEISSLEVDKKKLEKDQIT